MKLLCRIGLHKWTEDNKISRAMMIGLTGLPFGCLRCGIQKDFQGRSYPLPTKTGADNE